VSPGDPVPSRPPYTMVTEVAQALSAAVMYQTSYGYIRYSIAVHAGGLRAASKDGTDQDPPASNPDELIFWESSPQKGQFKILGDRPERSTSSTTSRITSEPCSRSSSGTSSTARRPAGWVRSSTTYSSSTGDDYCHVNGS
jgi:hypothetical protein